MCRVAACGFVKILTNCRNGPAAQALPRRTAQAPSARARPQPEPDGRPARDLRLLPQPSRAKSASGHRRHPAAAGRSVRRRHEGLRRGKRRHRRRHPARRNLLRPNARRSGHQPLRTDRAGRQRPLGRGGNRPALHRRPRAPTPSGRRRGGRRRSARPDHARDLGPRLYPGPAKPLARARGGLGDARRRARITRSRSPSRCASGSRRRGGSRSGSSIRKSSRTPASITTLSGGC